MDNDNQIRKWIAAVVLVAVYCACPASAIAGNVVIENEMFRYEITADGRNLRFVDKADGTNYLDTAQPSYCAYVTRDGAKHNATSATLKKGLLQLVFKTADVTATVRLERRENWIVFHVVEVKGAAESFTFINVPLSLEGLPNEPFAVCALSMNLQTDVLQLPALQDHLMATCYKRFGMVGAEVSMLGVPQKTILPVIREVMKNAEDIPLSTEGGAWAQMKKEGYGSYLMNFGTLTEETVDEWIDMCARLGFNQISNHGNPGFFKFGSFELDEKKWPDQWQTFKRINQRLHAAGISSIFHTYAFFIAKQSRYVTPVPHPDLAYFRSFTLTRPIGADDKELVVDEVTTDVSAETGWRVENSNTLRIGEELIQFSGVTKSPPYKFTGLTRGAYGTKATSHAAKTEAYHLKEMFGRFLPGPETALFKEIARRTAEIVNEADFDGIYLDAIDASHVLAGQENFWYYGTRFVFEIAKHLDEPVGMEMSSMIHHWWHYRSRWQAWDRPHRGYKRFIDIHLAAIKSDEYKHGLWRGHTPLIDKLASLENGGLLLPLHLGWWGLQTWDPPQIAPTFPDDIEYLGSKMIGNNAGLSMLGGVDEKTLQENPLFARLTSIIKQYEELRHKRYFSDSVRALLRQPGKEFTLFQEEDGDWNFKPVTYQKHKVVGADDRTFRWTVVNQFDDQPVQLRIFPLMSVQPYDHPANVVIAGFSKDNGFIKGGSADGVSGKIQVSPEVSMGGEAAGAFTARSSGVSPHEGSWIRMEKRFEPPLDLSANQALGVWIHGDGNGQLLNLSLRSPFTMNEARADHFVKIDFTGWKYFELVETESTRYSDYLWPSSSRFTDLGVYDSYRNNVRFNSVDKLQLWYNGLPENKDVSCLIGPVKAVPMVPATIQNPSITIAGETIVFPVTMESGMYIELKSRSDCKLYGSKGELLQEVELTGKIPTLHKGENEVIFKADEPGGRNQRVEVTVIGEGEPLIKSPR